MPIIEDIYGHIDHALSAIVSSFQSCFPGEQPELRKSDSLPVPETGMPNNRNSDTIVNGIALPPRVVEELQQLGIALSWYSIGELEDAVEACAFDGQLIDDPDGVDFEDRLHLTREERLKHEREHAGQHSAAHEEDEGGDGGNQRCN